jgi:hypothetical protein
VISRRLHTSSAAWNGRLGVGRGYDDSSDGCSLIASWQLGQRRFCRRSQLWNSRSQRRHATGPAYRPCFGALRWGPFRFMDVLSGARHRLVWMGQSSALTYDRPAPPTAEGHAPFATSPVHIRIGHFRRHQPTMGPRSPGTRAAGDAPGWRRLRPGRPKAPRHRGPSHGAHASAISTHRGEGSQSICWSTPAARGAHIRWGGPRPPRPGETRPRARAGRSSAEGPPPPGRDAQSQWTGPPHQPRRA